MILDYAMPGMSGADVARQARQVRPGLGLLFITGFADRSALGEVGESAVLGKPFGQDELARKVATALAAIRAGNVVPLRASQRQTSAG